MGVSLCFRCALPNLTTTEMDTLQIACAPFSKVKAKNIIFKLIFKPGRKEHRDASGDSGKGRMGRGKSNGGNFFRGRGKLCYSTIRNSSRAKSLADECPSDRNVKGSDALFDRRTDALSFVPHIVAAPSKLGRSALAYIFCREAHRGPNSWCQVRAVLGQH